MKNIVVAVDYNSAAETVAKAGYELAKALKAQTILLHVVTDPTYYSSLKYSPIFGFDNFSDLDLIQTDTAEQLVTGSYKYLEKLKKGLGNGTIKTVVKEGECGETIIESITEMDADIIVIGTHNQGNSEKKILGSIAEYVLQHSVLPVLTIPVK